MTIYKIYTLSDPRNNVVRYVGYTRYPLKNRLACHLCDKSTNHRTIWIKSLSGRKPDIELLAEFASEVDVKAAEVAYIAMYKALGAPLVNGTAGGDGTSGWIPSAETRRKIGAGNTGKVRNNENWSSTFTPVVQLRLDGSVVHRHVSMSAAARRTGLDLGRIWNVCNNRRGAKTTGGFVWRYDTDDVLGDMRR